MPVTNFKQNCAGLVRVVFGRSLTVMKYQKDNFIFKITFESVD